MSAVMPTMMPAINAQLLKNGTQFKESAAMLLIHNV
jgi:hypothetical protein